MNGRQPRKIGCAGFTLIEVVSAVAVVMVLLMVMTQMLVLVIEQSRRVQQRHATLEAAASAMEIVTSHPYAELDADLLERATVRQLFDELAPDWTITLQVDDINEPANGKLIRVSVTPENAPPNQKPIVLTAWRFEGV